MHFDTLTAYCEGIGIPPPKWEGFDIRDFKTNMATVHHQMPPFKHEFYAIAVKIVGKGKVSTGQFELDDTCATVFFNSPYQIIHWDIAPDWEGYYVIFSEAFYRKNCHRQRLIEAFPYLLVDYAAPMDITQDEATTFTATFEEIAHEHELGLPDCEPIIQNYLEILLRKVDRLFKLQNEGKPMAYGQRDGDLALVSRFQALIETSFRPGQSYSSDSPHQVAYYADRLSLHPNHLNAVVKRITDNPASILIQKHVLALAKSRLSNATLSVKEVAYDLYYEYPNHFASFFKKQTGHTPSSYRQLSANQQR